MSSKVKCTCGWSWNKSDSSNKDMYICHECGRDNSNNIPKAQEGLKTMSSRDKRGVELLIKETENAKKDKRELQTTGQIKNPKSIAYKSKVKKQPELKQDNRTDYEREYDREKGQAKEDKKQFKKNIIAPLDVATDIMQLGNFIPEPNSQTIGKIGNVAGMAIDAYQAYDDLSEGNYTDAAINAGSIFLPMGLDSKTFRRNSKYLQPGQPLYPFSPQARNNFIDRAHYIEPFTKVKGMTDTSLLANRALLGTLGAETVYDIPKQKNGGWLDSYADGGTMQEHQENYNDAFVSLPEGFVGEGTFNGPKFNNPAWGGAFQMGGSIPGAVGFSYARTQGAAPSNGKYAKKTMASAQNGKLFSENVLPKSNGVKDTRNIGDVMKLQSMYNTDEVNYVPTTKSLKGLKNKNLSPVESAATDQFVNWYLDPATLKRVEATGYDPNRIQDFVAKGLRTPIQVNDRSGKFPMNSSGEGEYRSPYTSNYFDDDTHADTGYIMYNPQGTDNETQSVLGHELSHASGLDNLLAPSLYRALGKSLPEKYHSGLNYMDRPEEVYGNFHEMRLQMGLKPGQKIDYKTLNDKMGNDKIPNNFWRSFSADPKTGKPDPNRIKKIVKAINTVAYNPNEQGDMQTAQNGQEMKYYQEGLDWQPKMISKNGGWLDSYEDGGVIKDDRGQWDHPGEITEIGSNDITMQGVPYDVLGISDTGDVKMMKPGKDYKFKGKKVTEYPMAKNGMRQEQKSLQNLDNLTNFTNYNTKQPGGWLDQFN